MVLGTEAMGSNRTPHITLNVCESQLLTRETEMTTVMATSQHISEGGARLFHSAKIYEIAILFQVLC